MGKSKMIGSIAALVCIAFVAGMTQLGPAEHQAATIEQASPAEVTGLQPWVIENTGGSAQDRQDIVDCPPGSLYSQPVDTDLASVASTSDYRGNQKIYDNFWGVSESICDIHWWGVNADAALTECVKSPDRFEITFYNDDGLGAPGTIACGPYIVTPVKVVAGTWNAYTLYYYSTVLSPCCNLASGWVSITGLDDAQDCYFWWVSSAVGDGTSWVENPIGGAKTAMAYDFSFCLTGHCIPPGQDCWSTSCYGGGTQADFSNNPIPADFFGPGSDPFDGVIALGGDTGMIDTILERKGWLCFPEPLPSTAQVELELIALDLVSCAPITVTYYGGGSPEDWDVDVGLAGPQDPGMLNATKTHDNGGYFDASFSVQPLYTFTRVSDAQTEVFDPRDHGITPIAMGTGGDAYWSTMEDYEHCTMDGFAGGYATPPDKEECCPETCHDSYGEGHLHCAKPPECPECPECEATADQQNCKRVVCPDPIEECKPVRIQQPPPILAPRAAGDPLPEGGTDEIDDTTGDIYVEAMPGNIYFPLLHEVWYFEIQEGPPNVTTVEREDPMCEPLCTIEMEMTAMNLVAYDGVFHMNVNLNPDPTWPSEGYAQEDELPSGDFPVDSFFDVYVEVQIPEIPTNVLHNEMPIPLEAPGIVDLPPWGAEYQVPAGWEGVQLYDGTIPTGLWIRWVFHRLPPPWRVVECECLEPDEVHVDHDPAAGLVWCEGFCPPGYLPALYSQPNPDLSVDYWCECDCACGDVDHSGGLVDLVDFATFALCFGQSGPIPGCDAEAFDCSDVNGDVVVDLTDFATFALWFGLQPVKTVPDCNP